jgi:hypothetical protein
VIKTIYIKLQYKIKCKWKEYFSQLHYTKQWKHRILLVSWIKNILTMVIQNLSVGVKKCWWLLDAKCYHVFMWHQVQTMGYLVVLDNILMLSTNGYDKIGVWVFKFLVNILIDCKCD